MAGGAGSKVDLRPLAVLARDIDLPPWFLTIVWQMLRPRPGSLARILGREERLQQPRQVGGATPVPLSRTATSSRSPCALAR